MVQQTLLCGRMGTTVGSCLKPPYFHRMVSPHILISPTPSRRLFPNSSRSLPPPHHLLPNRQKNSEIALSIEYDFGTTTISRDSHSSWIDEPSRDEVVDSRLHCGNGIEPKIKLYLRYLARTLAYNAPGALHDQVDFPPVHSLTGQSIPAPRTPGSETPIESPDRQTCSWHRFRE